MLFALKQSDINGPEQLYKQLEWHFFNNILKSLIPQGVFMSDAYYYAIVIFKIG